MRYSMMKKSAGNMMIGNGNSCLVAKERIKDMMKEKDREKNKEVNKMKEREDMEKRQEKRKMKENGILEFSAKVDVVEIKERKEKKQGKRRKKSRAERKREKEKKLREKVVHMKQKGKKIEACIEEKKEEIGFIHEEAERKLVCAGVKGKENAKIVLRCEAKMIDEGKRDIWNGILDGSGSTGMLINEKEFWKEEIRYGFVEEKEWKEGIRRGFWIEEWKNGFVEEKEFWKEEMRDKFIEEKRAFEGDLRGRWRWLKVEGKYAKIMMRAGEKGRWGAVEIRGKDKREWYMDRDEVRKRIDVREKIRIAERMEIKT